MDFTLFSNVKNSRGDTLLNFEWSDFVGCLRRESEREFPVMSKTESSLTLPAWSPAVFSGSRSKDNVRLVSMLVLDFDKVLIGPEEVAQHFPSKALCIHTTRSDAPKARSYRAILPYDKALSSEEHPLLWLGMHQYLKSHGISIDKACRDASRLYFLPVTISGKAPVFLVERGALLNTQKLINFGRLELQTAEAAKDEEEVQRESSPSILLSQNAPDVIERATRYLAKACPAIQGSFGSQVAFRVAACFGRPFRDELDVQTAWRLFESVYNSRCSPPWKGRELTRHLKESIFLKAWSR